MNYSAEIGTTTSLIPISIWISGQLRKLEKYSDITMNMAQSGTWLKLSFQEELKIKSRICSSALWKIYSESF